MHFNMMIGKYCLRFYLGQSKLPKHQQEFAKRKMKLRNGSTWFIYLGQFQGFIQWFIPSKG